MSLVEKLEFFEQEINNAVEVKAYYPAISIALTIPAICAALESSSGSTAGQDAQLYKKWYDEYLGTVYSDLTADDCYSLRCGVVHQGRFGHPAKMQNDRVMFTLPEKNNNIFRIGKIGNGKITILQVDLVLFCSEMVSSMKKWCSKNENNQNAIKNSVAVVRLHPNGYPPFMIGIPIIL